jgi:hypothetical protein
LVVEVEAAAVGAAAEAVVAVDLEVLVEEVLAAAVLVAVGKKLRNTILKGSCLSRTFFISHKGTIPLLE